MVAILKSNMAAQWLKYAMQIVNIGFLAVLILYLGTRINFRSTGMDKCRFRMAAILNTNMADMKREFRVAQYLKIFSICQCTFVPNLVLVSQNEQ